MRPEATSRPIPNAPLERRCYAFALDFLVISLISWPLGGASPFSIVQLLAFLGLWMGMRVLGASRFSGMSLGRWAFDVRVVDLRYGRTPGLSELIQREGIAGGAAMLAFLGLRLSLVNALSLILLVAPLAVDCGMAWSDGEFPQAYHDRIAKTKMAPTKRGFSLDLRVKRILAQFKQKMK